MPPPRLSLARLPTPLQPLDRLSLQVGGPRIWVKRDDLSDCAASGNKIRKLEYTLAQALADGCDSLITCGGLQSNHCRATALMGAKLGLRVDLLLRGEQPGDLDGNLFLDHLAGAHVHYHAARVYQLELDVLLRRHADRLRGEGLEPFVIPTGASDEIGVWGYVNAAQELRADFEAAGIAPRHIVAATGSGGTQAGLSAGVRLHGIDAEVWGMAVCDDVAWFRNKVRKDLAAWKSRYAVDIDLDRVGVNVLDQYIGAGYAQASNEVFATIALAARVEGLVLDPVYTGKAFHGMLEEIRGGRFAGGDDIVFVHTGGIFGLMAQRAQAMSVIGHGARE
jgi:D-cysteine desulfhydrase